MNPRPRVVVSWSSGKDAAWMLHTLRQRGEVDVVGLLTSMNATAGRVAMHAVRADILRTQANRVGLPLRTIDLPWPCPNGEYEQRMAEAVAAMRDEGVTHVAFGDLFLRDVRAYRERQLAETGLAPLFPLWELDTAALARDMIRGGFEAVTTCVDREALDASFVGRRFDDGFLDALPATVDPCGERGEFHTCVVAGPMFASPIPWRPGERRDDERFTFIDLLSD